MTLQKYNLGELQPTGWLKKQLLLQANGLTGKLDEIWADVGENSAWLGGTGEAWERGPYYLDGLVPLAYLLDDDALKAKAIRWVEAILASQTENGNFGPAANPDWWARILALKPVVSYHRATNERRALQFLKRFFGYMLNEAERAPFFLWTAARCQEALIPLRYYMDITGDTTVSGLANILAKNSLDWNSFLNDLPYPEEARRYMSPFILNTGRKILSMIDKNNKQGGKKAKPMPRARAEKLMSWRFLKNLMLTHGVNVAMALKYPVLQGQFLGRNNEALTKKGIERILACHGTATGMFTSDESLNGPHPHRGSELCAVVEAMFSYACLLEATGDTYYAELLESLAFNALPATFNRDMTAHQYVQQVNQISATIAPRDFFDVWTDANVFGLEPNFGCCTANLHQGFPKFAENLIYRTEKGLSFLLYSPCTLRTTVHGEPLVLHEETDYPFSGKIRLRFEEAPLAPLLLTFRVPEGTSLTVGADGKGILRADSGTATLHRAFLPGDELELNIYAPLRKVELPGGSFGVKKGTLLFATKLAHQETALPKGTPPFHDRSFTTPDAWNFIPVLNGKETYTEHAIGDIPFDEENPPLELQIPGYEVLNWKEQKNSAPLPMRPEIVEIERELTLVPYGATRVRVAQYPEKTLK